MPKVCRDKPSDNDPKRRLRSQIIVINNYTEKDVDDFKNLAGRCNGLVGAYEVGATGTPHIQGYAEFTNQISWMKLKKLMPRAHLEDRWGTPEEAWKYCLKGEQSHEEWSEFKWNGPNYGKNVQECIVHGTYAEQGKRSDLDDVAAMIVDGATTAEVALTHPKTFIQCHKGIEALRYRVLKPRRLDQMPEVIVRYGPTGTWKSRCAREKDWPGIDYYKWSPGGQGKWWNGYDGQEKVIIEEFRGQMPFAYMLDLLDRYEFQIEAKGAMAQMVADKFVITSPISPALWYKYEDMKGDESLLQLKRRITTIYLMGEGGTETIMDKDELFNPQPVDFTDQFGPAEDPLFGGYVP